MRNNDLKNATILLLLAIIWGFAFSAQSLGADSLSPFTFFAFRNYFAVITMGLLFIFFRKDDDLTDNPYSIKLGILCGLIEFAASICQQVGVSYTTAANCSFITAMYVILVPVIGTLFGNKTDKKVWFCVALEIIGLYLLCVKDGFSINKGDFITLGAAILFALHIIVIDRGGRKIDSILFCFVQFIVCALSSTICMFIFEAPVNFGGIRTALVPLLYTGILSSAICVTLQVVVQKETDPTVASLIMCLESVFGAVGGWLILNEILSTKEIIGCLIMFIAIVISQLPSKKKE